MLNIHQYNGRWNKQGTKRGSNRNANWKKKKKTMSCKTRRLVCVCVFFFFQFSILSPFLFFCFFLMCKAVLLAIITKAAFNSTASELISLRNNVAPYNVPGIVYEFNLFTFKMKTFGGRNKLYGCFCTPGMSPSWHFTWTIK